MEKNLRQILGVSADADISAIKLAYRRLARRYHPDLSTEPNASEKFAEITEAYRTLHAEEILKANRHKVQRSTTQSAHTAAHTASDNARQTSGSRQNFEKTVRAHADSRQAKKSSADKCSEPRDAKSGDCELSAHLSIEELYWGTELRVDPSSQCPGRRGHDFHPPQLLNLKIRPGIQPGQRLRIREPDVRHPDNSGSIYVTIRLKPHERYDLVENNLYVDLPLSSWEAQHGATIDVVTPGGRLDVNVPAGISSGQLICVPKRGLPKSPDEYGDLFAVARIVSLDERTRKKQRWPQVPHRDVKHWRPVGGYKATSKSGNAVDTFA